MPTSTSPLPLPGRLERAQTGRPFLVLSALAFSTAGFFTREAPVDVWAMVFWRNLFGSAALLPFVLAGRQGLSWQVFGGLGRWGWATIGASAFATICFLASFAHTSVAHVSIIYATAPLMTALIAWLWLGERVTPRTLLAAVLALLGVAATVAGSMGGGMLLGDGLAFAMALSMSLMTVMARRHPKLPPLLTACVTSLAAALAVLPLGWAAGASFVVSSADLAWLAAFGLTTMAVALPLYLAGTAHVPAGQAMLISALEMPLAPLWVWLAFAETPSVATLFGGGIVALAILWQMRAEA